MVPRPRLIALNPKYRRPQHRWTQEERMIVCCMKRFFDLRLKDITTIFNYTYKNKLRSERFTEGLPRSTIATQWEDIRRKNHSDWHAVHTDVSFEQGPALFSHLIEKIRHACRVLQIGLVARARDLAVTLQGPIHRRVSQNNSTIGNGASGIQVNNAVIHSQIVDQDRQATPTPSSHRPQSPQASEAILTNATSQRPVPEVVARIRTYALGSNTEQPTRPSQVPGILWRFSNDESMGVNHRSGYIASAFINDFGNIPTPDDRAREFAMCLEIHVRPLKIPSPFISTSTDPLVAVHRALTRDKNAFISIIDSTQITPQNIFYMKDLMGQFNIYTPGYRGAKEYVVWGFICRPAIVTSIRADTLLHIANTYPDIRAALRLDIISASSNCKSQLHNRLAAQTFESDFEVGRTIGKFLHIIHLLPDFVEDVAKSMNTFWSFTVSDDTAEFLRGVNQGFQTTTAPLSPAHVPETTFHSQETVSSQSQHESTSDNVTQQVAQDVDMQDYVIVDHPQQGDIVDRQTTELRESMDRFSIQDDAEDFSDHQIGTVIRSSPGIASTTATRTISIFNPGSESWVMVPDQPSTPGVVRSIENTLPISAQEEEEEEEDDDDEANVKIETDMEPSVRASAPQRDIGSQELAVFRAPATPSRNHTRNYSESSESTIGAQTPGANHRFSEERSHVNRVLSYDWPTFWDQLHDVASQ